MGSLEVDAEMGFAGQDIYEGLAPVEGRGRSTIGQGEKANFSPAPLGALGCLWTIRAVQCWAEKVRFLYACLHQSLAVGCCLKGMLLGGWQSVAEADPEGAGRWRLSTQSSLGSASPCLPYLHFP